MPRYLIAGLLFVYPLLSHGEPSSGARPFSCQGKMFEENLADDRQLFVPQVLYFQISKQGELWFGAQNAEILSRSSYQTWKTSYIRNKGEHYYIARGTGVATKGPLQGQKFSGSAYLTVKKTSAEASVLIEMASGAEVKKFAFVSSSCSN